MVKMTSLRPAILILVPPLFKRTMAEGLQDCIDLIVLSSDSHQKLRMSS